ncbi:MAG: YiiD C-terminal domain-containing protein [Acidobacteriota bacterium]|nr:YiiD C-terminal domain-containing protein [Acidobacteriota bacterium]
MRLVSFYPPYLGAGVRVTHPKDDAYRIVVRMALRWWNKNLFGTQFGGSLYSMCDPHFVFILLRNLGPGYVVWNKSAEIEFLRPGRGRVTATFHVPPEKIAEIRAGADRGEKVEPMLVVEIVADDGSLVARVTETLWVRKKDSPRT